MPLAEIDERGVVLGIGRPDLRSTLLGPLARRVGFLAEVVEGLGLDGVTVVRGRAETRRASRRVGVATSVELALLAGSLGRRMQLVAPRGALTELKNSLNKPIAKLVIDDLQKDLTNVPDHDLTQHLAPT